MNLIPFLDSAQEPTSAQVEAAIKAGYTKCGFYLWGQTPPLDDPYHVWAPATVKMCQSLGMEMMPIWVPSPGLPGNPVVEAHNAFNNAMMVCSPGVSALYDGNHIADTGSIAGPVWDPIPGSAPSSLGPLRAIQYGTVDISGWGCDISLASPDWSFNNTIVVDFEYNTAKSVSWYQSFQSTIKQLGNHVTPIPADEVVVNTPRGGICACPTGGYWVWTTDGGVFPFGGAHFVGSLGGIKLVAPIESMSATPTGMGYYLKGQDGAVFAFGDAHYAGRVVQGAI